MIKNYICDLINKEFDARHRFTSHGTSEEWADAWRKVVDEVCDDLLYSATSVDDREMIKLTRQSAKNLQTVRRCDKCGRPVTAYFSVDGKRFCSGDCAEAVTGKRTGKVEDWKGDYMIYSLPS